MSESNTPCIVYRCARQQEMYLYLRPDLKPDALPEALLRRTGPLSEVMKLELTAQRKLARADVAKVIERLTADGFYLQMPPNAQINPHLHFGD